MRLRVMVVAAAASLAAAVPADAATMYTIAGAESTSARVPAPCWAADFCDVPRRWPRSWVATERRLKATCLTHLRDGTIIVCQGSELLRLDRDGRMRRWVKPDVGWLIDADAAADDSVVVLGRRGVTRVGADGAMIEPQAMPDGWSARSAIAAMPDGSAWITGQREGQPELRGTGVLRVGADGRYSVVTEMLPLVGTSHYSDDPSDDLVALSDGTALVAIRGERRVLELAPTGRVKRLTAATGAVTAAAALADRTPLVASDRGLLSLRDGRSVRSVARGSANDYDPVEPTAITIDGRAAARSTLVRVRRLDALENGTILALLDGPDGDDRVIAIPARGPQPRLAVALPAENRTTLRQGAVRVVATRRARAVITIEHAGRVVVRSRASLHAGHNRIPIRVPAATGALVAYVTVTDRDRRVATHRLAFVPTWRLSAAELHVIRRLVQEWGSLAVNTLDIFGCRRTAPTAFGCRWEDWAEGTLLERGSAMFALEWDGLVRATLRDDESGRSSSLFFEPRPLR